MRSSKTMKRKWRESNANRGPKPQKSPEEEEADDQEVVSSEDEYAYQADVANYER